MTRALKLFLLAAVAAMTLMLAVFAWAHWDAISRLPTLDDVAKRRVVTALAATAFWPLWTGLLGVMAARQLAQRDLQFSPRHRRFYESSIVIAVLFFAAIQGGFAFGSAYPPFNARGVLLRAVWVFCGLFTMVYGNFNAKAPPPSGALAPAPADWIRGMLRNGWALVILGLAQALAAVILPARLLPIAVLAMLLPTLLIARSQHRLLWPSRGRSAKA